MRKVHLGNSSWNKGKRLSERTRLLISLAKTGKKRQPFTEEHRRNISIASRNRWARIHGI